MSDVVVAVALGLVALAGTAVVVTNPPDRQAVTLSVYGVMLAVLFMVLQAPDVALAAIAVSTAALPLMVLLTIRKVESSR